MGTEDRPGEDRSASEGPASEGPASERVRLRRGAHNGVYEHGSVLAVLDAGMIAHVGVTTAEGPFVIPMAYGRSDDSLYLHGSVANAALRAADGADVCVTVTIVDGLIVGRSPFHNSMQYRSVVVRGRARRVRDDAEQLDALRRVSDHVVATWDGSRPPTVDELARTMVIAVPLVEVSAKVRIGGPVDEPEDLDGPHWGGSVPIIATFGDAVPSPDLRGGTTVPSPVAALAGTRVHGPTTGP